MARSSLLAPQVAVPGLFLSRSFYRAAMAAAASQSAFRRGQCIFVSMRGYTQDKDAYLKRLRRVEGQVRGLQRMVEEDTYCVDVLTQISAATRALQAVAIGLLEDHLGHCVTQAIEQGGPDAQEKVREATAAISRLVKS
jgi:DNA-binding FrmR family transcriptional regulator